MSSRKKSDTPTPTTNVNTFMEQVSDERRTRSEQQNSEVHDKIWMALGEYGVQLKTVTGKMDRIYGALAILVIILGVGIPVCYYALKGVITEELDKRIPLVSTKCSSDLQKKEANAVAVIVPVVPCTIVPTAQVSK